MTIGQRIKATRKKAGMTQTELAKKLGIPYQSISQWERDERNPKLETLRRISDALNVNLVDLVPHDEEDLQYIENYVSSTTGRDRQKIREDYISEILTDLPFELHDAALDAADMAVVESYKAIPDSYLKQQYLESFRYLNRRGRIEAVERMNELNENPRFKAAPAEDSNSSTLTNLPSSAEED